ncbi:MAG TPA: D-alanyl-D-alanine carboxypeptidase/D-alanyl-D-alanine-endopeptidase [Porphyromonadaceae bacterium]|jgi:D-alanyl-D-alanine carboxypeptidase/D-alanyl-D-alanine-endopeptidase (penicillin-binding protein 4)|nr:D-alanyl-D-alanine carboxypeptidase/D-alanyl-D-alanine-endopeptidase [Porphyromonadaceae bacterium]HBX21641.1 D-alanyl-D-alanine carboxypeptidase/D-alanyl-D-alanine-endopeptidase [Porphyromonadaceae bacterium]HCM19696.1 D-alanyl-D-alanine carboxypeptidase/D-alanyl-D-alanine-endopeptidase [Porphyromonadaceae bacterium]
MKPITFLLFFCAFVYAGYSQPVLQHLLNDPALKHASVGVCVTDLNTGKEVLRHDAEKSLTPASTLKLITTATALELFGENYRYKTDIALDTADPSRILVLGSGDPTLGSEAFGNNPNAFFTYITEALKNVLPGDNAYSIYVVDNLFGYDGISPEWTWIDIGNYYASGAYGISIFDNSYKIVFDTSDRNIPPRILRTEPEIKGLTFVNHLSLNNSGRDNGYIYGTPFSYEKTLKGDIPAGKSRFSIKGDIPDPGLLLGQTLAEYMTRAGYRIEKVETARQDYLLRFPNRNKPLAYSVGNVLCTQTSRPLKEIIREINVTSNNHYTEHLIRTLGRSQAPDIYADALQQGIDFVNDYWRQKGISTSSLTMYDGCGLAPQNAVSPAFLNQMLYYMYTQSRYADAFYQSLPQAGKDGTLTNFMQGTKNGNYIHAKSGSIGGVQCYSGYLIDKNKKYAFTIMVNTFNGTRSQVKSAIERFLSTL